MTKLESVIKGLRTCLDYRGTLECGDDCPYLQSEACDTELMKDALKLLKEQEAVKPYMDYDGQDVWRCGECGNSLMHPSYYDCDNDAKNYIRYCSHCGRAVKWDEPPKEGDGE